MRFFNERVGFAVKSFGFFAASLKYTNDGGNSWKEIDKGSLNYYVFNFNNIWKVERSQISHSVDMGKNWLASLPKTKSVSQIFFIDELNGWILHDGIQCTRDGGKTWINQKLIAGSNLEEMLTQIFFIDKDNGWVTTVRGKIFKTNNGGDTWRLLKTNTLFEKITKIYFLNDTNGWILCPNGFIYNTIDGGVKWDRVNILDFI